MFKQIIAASVLGASTLGMMAANASTNGMYVTGQLGLAHRGDAVKIAPGLPSDVTISKDKAKMANLAGRIAIGYQFTPHWAVELGYLQLGQQKSTINAIDTVTTTGFSPIIIHGEPQPMTISTTTQVKQLITINQHAFDVVGKGIYPINDKFNVYAKAGMAYLITHVKGGVVDGQSIIAPIAKHNWAPEAGIGLTYNMTSNVFIDTSITHIQPIGKKNKPNNIDFAAVGIGYSFG